jgi:hypothetical protein
VEEQERASRVVVAVWGTGDCGRVCDKAIERRGVLALCRRGVHVYDCYYDSWNESEKDAGSVGVAGGGLVLPSPLHTHIHIYIYMYYVGGF